MSQNDPDGDGDDRSGITRRRVVASGAASWATVSLAGCSRLADPGTDDDDGENGDGENGDGENGDGETDGNETTDNTTVTNETTTTNESDEEWEDCSISDNFAAGMEIGLHVDVFDDYSGDHLGSDALDSVTVEFPDADFDPLELNWNGDHEAYSPTTWGTKLVTSEDVDPGTYRYEITVDGKGVNSETIIDEFRIV